MKKAAQEFKGFMVGDTISVHGITGKIIEYGDSGSQPILVRYAKNITERFNSDGKSRTFHKEPAIRVIARPKPRSYGKDSVYTRLGAITKPTLILVRGANTKEFDRLRLLKPSGVCNWVSREEFIEEGSVNSCCFNTTSLATTVAGMCAFDRKNKFKLTILD